MGGGLYRRRVMLILLMALIYLIQVQLDNGLTLLVHQDRKAPIVAVNIWYHVGSKDERPGITGFAHLFEHLMFNGSENYDGEWFLPLQEAGGTDLNGTTWFDRTNYFQNVPAPALDMVLWIESDRWDTLLMRLLKIPSMSSVTW